MTISDERKEAIIEHTLKFNIFMFVLFLVLILAMIVLVIILQKKYTVTFLVAFYALALVVAITRLIYFVAWSKIDTDNLNGGELFHIIDVTEVVAFYAEALMGAFQAAQMFELSIQVQ